MEDIVPARQTVINLLRVLGFTTFHEAADGQEALDILRRVHDIGFIISDWKMPRMSGIALLKEVRACPDTKDIPFLLLTSMNESQDVALAMDLGVSGYLVKPVTIRALKEKIASIREGRGMGMEGRVIPQVEKMLAGGMVEEAEGFLAEALKRDRDVRPFVLYGYALVAIARKDFSGADRLLEECFEMAPVFTKALYTRSKILDAMGRFNEAEECVSRASDISPLNIDYFVQHGTLLLKQKKVDKARQKFSVALNTEPQNHQLKQDIWNTYLQQGLVEEVQRDFGPYIYSSLTAETLNNMALVMRKKGLVKDAVVAYREALRKAPDNAAISYNLAMAELHLGHRKKAAKYLESALGIDPELEAASRVLESLQDEEA